MVAVAIYVLGAAGAPFVENPAPQTNRLIPRTGRGRSRSPTPEAADEIFHQFGVDLQAPHRQKRLDEKLLELHNTPSVQRALTKLGEELYTDINNDIRKGKIKIPPPAARVVSQNRIFKIPDPRHGSARQAGQKPHSEGGSARQAGKKLPQALAEQEIEKKLNELKAIKQEDKSQLDMDKQIILQFYLDLIKESDHPTYRRKQMQHASSRAKPVPLEDIVPFVGVIIQWERDDTNNQKKLNQFGEHFPHMTYIEYCEKTYEPIVQQRAVANRQAAERVRADEGKSLKITTEEDPALTSIANPLKVYQSSGQIVAADGYQTTLMEMPSTPYQEPPHDFGGFQGTGYSGAPFRGAAPLPQDNRVSQGYPVSGTSQDWLSGQGDPGEQAKRTHLFRRGIQALNEAEHTPTASIATQNSEAITFGSNDLQDYIDQWKIIKAKAQNLTWPILTDMLIGTNSTIIITAAWSIYADLIPTQWIIIGPFFCGLTSLPVLDKNAIINKETRIIQGINLLLEQGVLNRIINELYAKTYDKAYNALNQSGYLKDLEVLTYAIGHYNKTLPFNEDDEKGIEDLFKKYLNRLVPADELTKNSSNNLSKSPFEDFTPLNSLLYVDYLESTSNTSLANSTSS